jgi:hypothetical protein
VPALLVSSILIWLVAFALAAALRLHQASVATAALETELAVYLLACVAQPGLPVPLTCGSFCWCRA